MEAVANGEQAWEAAQRERPDLVLSDVLMPGLDGIGLTRKLRGAERTNTLPITLLTASSDRELMLARLEAGADDCLLKPFSTAELLVRLRCHRLLVEMRWEVAARQHDERFRLIVESARDYAIFTFDAQRLVTSWNSGAEVMAGTRGAAVLRVRRTGDGPRRNVAVEVRLIGDLLDVSRIVHSKLELNLEPLDLHDCLCQALEVSRAATAGIYSGGWKTPAAGRRLPSP